MGNPDEKPAALTHTELQLRAVKWLRNQGYTLAVAEAKAVACREQPDALGFDYKGRTALIEVKVDKKDFWADKKKPFRLKADLGIGLVRYYAAPKGMIPVESLPAGWGLLEPHGAGLRLVKTSDRFKANDRAALTLLVSICRFRSDEAKGEKGERLNRRRRKARN